MVFCIIPTLGSFNCRCYIPSILIKLYNICYTLVDDKVHVYYYYSSTFLCFFLLWIILFSLLSFTESINKEHKLKRIGGSFMYSNVVVSWSWYFTCVACDELLAVLLICFYVNPFWRGAISLAACSSSVYKRGLWISELSFRWAEMGIAEMSQGYIYLCV